MLGTAPEADLKYNLQNKSFNPAGSLECYKIERIFKIWTQFFWIQFYGYPVLKILIGKKIQKFILKSYFRKSLFWVNCFQYLELLRVFLKKNWSLYSINYRLNHYRDKLIIDYNFLIFGRFRNLWKIPRQSFPEILIAKYM